MDAVVLAGGESRRMGVPKALLPLEGVSLVRHVLNTCGPMFRKVFVVARVPETVGPVDAEVLTDTHTARGPLAGLARGLTRSERPWAFLARCDMPFINPAVVRRMADELDDCDVLAAVNGERAQPLHAFYNRSCLRPAEQLLDQGVSSLMALHDRCRVKLIPADEFRDIDPELLTFRDVDTLEEYQTALSLFPPSL